MAASRCSWQGVSHDLPPTWEVVGSYGGWKRGQILVAEDRQPRLAITWNRHQARPDLDRTLVKVARKHLREANARSIAPVQAWGPDAGAVALVGGTSEIILASRWYSESRTTLIWRQLSPGAKGLLRRITDATTVCSDGEPVPWRIHGLDLTLPPEWRSEGLQVLAGMVRAVWFRYRNPRSVDHVLVMRRYACATLILEGKPVLDWLRKQADEKETVTVLADGADHAGLTCEGPGKTLWRRLRGHREQRVLHAWLDPDADRLTVQETCGTGVTPMCLRQQGPSPRCGTPQNQEAPGRP